MKKIKVGIVNYLNTAPLIYGIRKSQVSTDIELIPDYPANLARQLIDGQIDIGLVPVAVIPHMKDWWLIGDYCIGADGAVASVCIFSDVSIQQVKKLILDYQSRTSVALARLLIRDYWKLDIEIVQATGDFLSEIKGTTAGLVIGDRALRQRKISPYKYDLAEAWKQHTHLPFVFAAWVSNKQLDENFIRAFNAANAYGVEHIHEVIAGMNNDLFDLDEYFRTCISYQFDNNKRKGLDLFLKLAKEINGETEQ